MAAFTVEITARWVSYYAETGEWLDGDYRLIREVGDDVLTFDPDNDEDAVRWAIHYLRSSESWEPSMSPIPDAVGEYAWLSACYEHPYDGDHLESTARLTGDWTDEQRAVIFREVTR